MSFVVRRESNSMICLLDSVEEPLRESYELIIESSSVKRINPKEEEVT